VGLSANLPLSRRVQLAVLAHIRHNHTRYDELLRETTWQNSRKAVESLCLDILVKWRGDEENGRDDLEEILREVVVISDSEEDDTESSDDESEDEASATVEPSHAKAVAPTAVASATLDTNGKESALKQKLQPQASKSKKRMPAGGHAATASRSKGNKRTKHTERATARKTHRGFKRYQAAWDQAIDRNRREDHLEPNPAPAHMARSVSHGSFLYSPTQPSTQPIRSLTGRGMLDGAAIHTQARPFADDLDLDFTRSRQYIAPLYGNQSDTRTNTQFTGTGPYRDGRDMVPPVPASSLPSAPCPDLPIKSIEGSLLRTRPSTTTLTEPVFVRSLQPRKRERDESPTQQPLPIRPAYPRPAGVVDDHYSKRQRLRLDKGTEPASFTDTYDLPLVQPSLPSSYDDPRHLISQVQVFRPISHHHRQDPPQDTRRPQPGVNDFPLSTWDNPILVESSSPSSPRLFIRRPSQEPSDGHEPRLAQEGRNSRYYLRSSQRPPDHYRRTTYVENERAAQEQYGLSRTRGREMYHAGEVLPDREIRPIDSSGHQVPQAESPRAPFYVRRVNNALENEARDPRTTQDSSREMPPFYVRSGTHAPARQPPDSRV
jgi:hypothetical protein